jgi:hypothetical protein
MTVKSLGIGLAAALLASTALPIQAKADDTRFDSPIVGSSPNTPIAGVPSGGAPWVVGRGRARLESDGSLEIEVTGLLLAAVVGPPTQARQRKSPRLPLVLCAGPSSRPRRPPTR